ncbi:tripartite tricarboxylate transporter permease [Cellvibrio polysaccharolyticus]|uniref:C4-dicarboxylate ABC transporter permease n=1 Tax=Cellvibrio polysaccharolyticus TaxID=2082724 RepID=A0A928YV81_9GAMM|nr:tripartite tricarboxylate transporter permease [Cellvibrio polysaccharolyticus]MBE8718275.1 C4-dicarboxylate ABC transporter permease [Cellvibrio polysaccharolyticus]
MMDMITSLLTWSSVLAAVCGVLIGIILGALPGLSVTMAVALLFPLTLGMNSADGIIMLLGIYVGGIYGGSIPAILLNTPGTPASVVTCFEGYPMTQRGEGDKALAISTLATFVGGTLSALVLIFLAPVFATFALKFSAPEFFALAALGLSAIILISSDNPVKGIIGGALGLLLSTVGVDAFTGYTRFTFDNFYLLGGISFVPVLIGLFAFSALMTSYLQPPSSIPKNAVKPVSIRGTLSHLKVGKRLKWPMFRSGLIGTFVGSVPGAGGDVAAFLSYTEAKRVSKEPETFGKGNLDGLASAESANNAVTGGAMVPLLTLGIPGDTVAAVILGAFMVHGLQPGPLLFQDHAQTVYMIFAGLLLINLLVLIFGLLGVRLFSRLNQVPLHWLNPVILILCVVGAYSVNNTLFDVGVMLVSGIVGYFLIRQGFGVAPIVLGMVLGPLLESNLRRMFILYDQGAWILLERPIALTFLTLMALLFLLPLLRRVWRARRAR